MAHHFGASDGLLETRQRAAKAAPSVAKLQPSVSACKSERASTVTYQGSRGETSSRRHWTGTENLSMEGKRQEEGSEHTDPK